MSELKSLFTGHEMDTFGYQENAIYSRAASDFATARHRAIDQVLMRQLLRYLGRFPSGGELIQHGHRTITTDGPEAGKECFYWNSQLVFTVTPLRFIREPGTNKVNATFQIIPANPAPNPEHDTQPPAKP